MHTAVAEGGIEAWDFVWDLYQKHKLEDIRNIYLEALAVTKHPWIISK